MGNARRRAFVIGNKDAIQDLSVVNGTFLINNLYATILFEFGSAKSFVTQNFKQLLNHEIKELEVVYEVEVANGQIERTTEILIDCTPTLNVHIFQINHMPMPIKSFDIIIGMESLAPHQAEIL